MIVAPTKWVRKRNLVSEGSHDKRPRSHRLTTARLWADHFHEFIIFQVSGTLETKPSWQTGDSCRDE